MNEPDPDPARPPSAGGADDWTDHAPFARRVYDDYDSYARHQAEKLRHLNLDGYTRKFGAALAERLKSLGFLGPGTSVLCLGARNGVECRAFIERGCFAVGVDLNPGEANPYVVTGDFHALQFATASVDVVFTNALDHAFDLDRMLAEIRRVLKPTGRFVAEIVYGSRDVGGREPGAYESLWWERIDDLLGAIAAGGFRIESRTPFSHPWNGDTVVLSPPR